MRRALALGLVAAVASVVAGVRLGARATTGGDAVAPDLRLRWPAGTAFRYAVTWRARTHASYQQQALDGDTDLDADLVVGAYGERPGGVTLLGFRFVELRRHGLRVLGKDLLADDATALRTLVGIEALLEVDARGRVHALRYPHDAPPLFIHVVQGLVAEAQITLPEGPAAAWTALESGPLARVEQRYDLDARFPAIVHRRVERLSAFTGADRAFLGGAVPDFAGRADALLDGAGRVIVLHAEETARVEGALEVSSSFSLERKGVAEPPAAAPDERALDIRLPGQAARALSAAELDERFAADLTAASVQATVDDYAHGIGMASSWIARATAFVRLHPEVVPALAGQFRTTARRGQELVFDILSGAGSPAAQATMRELIQGPEARADLDLYTQLLQRFSFVPAPEAATLELLERTYRRAVAAGDGPVAHATVYALGAEVGARRDGGVHARLLADLRDARTAEDRVALLAGLGNAGLPEGFDAIAALAGDGAEEVRAQVATSLRKYDTTAAREILYRLLAAREPPVAKCALDTLSALTLSADDIARVAGLVESRAIDGALDASLVFFAAGHADAPAPAARILRAVVAHASVSPEVANDAQAALQAVAR